MIEPTPFYQTTPIHLVELQQRIEKAKKQDERVLLILTAKPYPLTAYQVWQTYQSWFNNCPITSIRRSLTNLSYSDKVVKCPEMGQGQYGMLTHKWRLA